MMQQQRQQQQQSMQSTKRHSQVIQTHTEFRVDTFEYRILHEVEFRQNLTRHLPGEIEHRGPVTGTPQAPTVEDKPRSTKVTESSDAKFTVSLSANPMARVIWFKNGERLAHSNKYIMSQDNKGATLVVKNVNSADNGWYTMLAENNLG